MIEETIKTRLSAYPGLTALVGTRIYPVIMPEGVTYPGVVYQRISTMPREIAMGSDPGIGRARLQFTAWDNSYKVVKQIIEQIRLALERYNISDIIDIYVLAEYDLYDTDALKYGAALDFDVAFMEST